MCWAGILSQVSASRAFSPGIQNYNLLRFGSGRALQAFSSSRRNTVLQTNHTQPHLPSLQSVNSSRAVERALQQQIWVTHPTKDKRLQTTRARALPVTGEVTKITFRLLLELKIAQGEKNSQKDNSYILNPRSLHHVLLQLKNRNAKIKRQTKLSEKGGFRLPSCILEGKYDGIIGGRRGGLLCHSPRSSISSLYRLQNGSF